MNSEKRIKQVGDRVDSGLNCNDIQRYRPWLNICTATDQIKSVSAIGRRQTVEETGQGGTGKRMLERRYVAAKATYNRLLHSKIGILEGFFGPSSVHRGRTHIVLR